MKFFFDSDSQSSELLNHMTQLPLQNFGIWYSARLCNLVNDIASTTMPDLILHQGLTAINKYKNPALLSGMFPTQWLFDIGRFEDPSQQIVLSFMVQANYYFNIPNHSFHSHHAFMFMTLNIIQWRACYLQTHFTPKKKSIDHKETDFCHPRCSFVHSTSLGAWKKLSRLF